MTKLCLQKNKQKLNCWASLWCVHTVLPSFPSDLPSCILEFWTAERSRARSWELGVWRAGQVAGGGGFPVAGACETVCGDSRCQEASRAHVWGPGVHLGPPFEGRESCSYSGFLPWWGSEKAVQGEAEHVFSHSSECLDHVGRQKRATPKATLWASPSTASRARRQRPHHQALPKPE